MEGSARAGTYLRYLCLVRRDPHGSTLGCCGRLRSSFWCSTPAGTVSATPSAPTWSSSHVSHACKHVSFRLRVSLPFLLLRACVAEPSHPPRDVGVVPTLRVHPVNVVFSYFLPRACARRLFRVVHAPVSCGSSSRSARTHLGIDAAAIRGSSAPAPLQVSSTSAACDSCAGARMSTRRTVRFGAGREGFVLGRGRVVRFSHPRRGHVRGCDECARHVVVDRTKEEAGKARAAVQLLRWYKAAVSPWIPPSCRYVPTCSEYAMQAFATYGWWRGALMTTWRLARCQPFGGSGYDPATWENTPFATWWPICDTRDQVEEEEEGEDTCQGTSHGGSGPKER